MIALLKFILLGHLHKWERLRDIDVVDEKNAVVARDYECRCKDCGKIRRFRV